MAIANPRIHIICGICGCNSEFTYHYDESIDCDENGNLMIKDVHIVCGNCASLTALSELMEEEKK